MKQSLSEYIEGRLQLGGCGLFILIPIIVGAIIIVAVNQFIDSLSETWPIYLGIAVFVIVAFLILLCIGFREIKKREAEQENKSENNKKENK